MSGKTAQDWYHEGQTLSNLSKHEEALAACDKAIALKSNYTEALYQKGLALYSLKNYDKATKVANELTKLNPNSPLPYSILGLISAQKNNFDEALELYEKGISLDPSNPQNAKVLINKGNLHLNAYNDDIKAIETFHEAIKADPTYELGYINLGNAIRELRRYEEAIESYDKACKIQMSAYGLMSKAECLALMDKKKEAIKVYIEAYKQLQAGKPGIGLPEQKLQLLENEIKVMTEVEEVSEKCEAIVAKVTKGKTKSSSSQELINRLTALQTKKENMTIKFISREIGATVKDVEGLLAEFQTFFNDINKGDTSSQSTGIKTDNQDISKDRIKHVEKEKEKEKKKKPSQAACCNMF